MVAYVSHVLVRLLADRSQYAGRVSQLTSYRVTVYNLLELQTFVVRRATLLHSGSDMSTEGSRDSARDLGLYAAKEWKL
jgi:hypothetical protein